MEIREIQSKDIWEDFLLGRAEKTFLQSWNWGEFQKLIGNKIWRLGIYNNKDQDNRELFSVVLVARVTARRGTFLLVLHGPSIISNFQPAPYRTDLPRRPSTQSAECSVLRGGSGAGFLISNEFSIIESQRDEEERPLFAFKFQILNTLLDELRKIGNEEKADFIRIASLWPRNEENKKIFKDSGFRESPMHASAYEATWKLNITPSEEELLANMRKTTRYLIKQAQKNQDITIEKTEKIGDIELYQRLNKEIAKRQKFVPFSPEYIKNEFDVFSRDGQTLLFLGKYRGELAAAALVVFWSGIAFYHQAASLEKFAKFSIPYLLQWEAIKEAKRRGCVLYDFWGYVDPRKEPKHPWAGPTLFKMGFGGKPYEYVKTQDLPLSKKYWLTYFFEKLRKMKRGL